MKNIFKIHPLYIVAALISMLTGYFRLFITITLLILFHELGHILMMIYFDIDIKKIIILPFGAVTIVDDVVNRKLIDTFLIAVMGPIFQIIYYYLFKNPYLDMIHYPLLLFNLLPIIPLDGSKILNVFLNRFFSFYHSELINIYISFITIILITILKFHLIIILILSFLIKETIIRYKNRHYLLNRFLYERQFIKFNFKKRKIVNDKYDMKIGYKHLFYIKGKYYTEKEYIKLQ